MMFSERKDDVFRGDALSLYKMPLRKTEINLVFRSVYTTFAQK